MSILSKDMDMPTSCTMCWLNTFCDAWHAEPLKYKGYNKRLDGCHLAELIRCKDCEYYGYEEFGHWCAYDQYVETGEEFCSWAERKEQ